MDNDYKRQTCSLTLREALHNLQESNSDLDSPESFKNKQMVLFFEAHDCAHIVFGCSTSIRDESQLDIWSLFGTTMKWEEYINYLKDAEGRNQIKSLLKQIGTFKIVRETVLATPDNCIAFSRVLRMKKKWPFQGWKSYLDIPLAEIREEHGIKVVART